jgi:hypothetical protein
MAFFVYSTRPKASSYQSNNMPGVSEMAGVNSKGKTIDRATGTTVSLGERK